MSTQNIDNKPSTTPVLRHIGIASAIGIILVVFGHSLPPHLQFPDDDLFARISNHIIEFIYTFHMPLFFTLSGYLYVHTNPVSRQRGYDHLLKSKALRLLLPYLVLGTLAFLPKIMLAEYAKNPIEPTWGFYLESLLYPWTNSIRFFWFLPTLFAVFLFAPLLLRCLYFPNNTVARIIQLVLLGVLIWLNINIEHSANPATLFNYTGVLHNLVYFWFGMMAYTLINDWLDTQATTSTVNNLLLAAAILVISIIIYTTTRHSPFTALLNALLGISATVILALTLINIRHDSLHWIDRYSYQIYLLSFFFQVPIQLVMYHFLKTPSSLVFLSSFIAGLLGPLLIIYVINRFRLPGKVLLGL